MTEGGRYEGVDEPEAISIVAGRHTSTAVGAALVSWHEASVEVLYTDEAQTQPFTGTVFPARDEAVGPNGTTYASLYGDAVESGAPLTQEAFRTGLAPLGDWGHYIVVLGVFLFGISTAISWSYYGDRCVHYLLGQRAVLPYKVVFVGAHYFGAVVPLAVVWALGDVALSIVIWPNLIALLVLAPVVVQETRKYFDAKPYEATSATRSTPRPSVNSRTFFSQSASAR